MEQFEFSVRYEKGPDVRVLMPGDATIPEMVEAFRTFLLAVGYDAAAVAEHLLGDV